MTEQTLKWYDKYFTKYDYTPLTKEEYTKIMDKIKLLQTDNSIESKVIQLESEYQEKLKEYDILSNDKSKIEEIKKLNSLLILQKELDIIKLLTKYALQNNYLDQEFFINILKLILSLSNTLKRRINQKDISLEKKTLSDDNITRCSYKFCNYKDSCIYNYNKSKNLCYQDHYVHNMVCADIKILLEYIDSRYKNEKTFLRNKEILKTINTLSYVINHMENELKAKCLYVVNVNNDILYNPNSEIEQYHFIKPQK